MLLPVLVFDTPLLAAGRFIPEEVFFLDVGFSLGLKISLWQGGDVNGYVLCVISHQPAYLMDLLSPEMPSWSIA